MPETQSLVGTSGAAGTADHLLKLRHVAAPAVAQQRQQGCALDTHFSGGDELIGERPYVLLSAFQRWNQHRLAKVATQLFPQKSQLSLPDVSPAGGGHDSDVRAPGRCAAPVIAPG